MRFLAAIGALAIVVGIGCAAFFFGGYYSVAGTTEDPAAVTWALTRVRTASINRHANDNPPASFGDAAMVEAGAKAYASFGCANCHGAPGVKWLKFSEGLHPDPPGPEGSRRWALSRPTVLGDQERHQHDRHAQLRTGRRFGRRYLVNCGVRQEIAERLRRRLQDLDRIG